MLLILVVVLFGQIDTCLLQELPLPPAATAEACAYGLNETSSPLDCFPEPGASEQECLKRGCCWHEVAPGGRPFCYFPDGFNAWDEVTDGSQFTLTRKYRSQFPGDINSLRGYTSGSEHLAIKIVPAEEQRWQTPYPKIPEMQWGKISAGNPFQVKFNEDGNVMSIQLNGKIFGTPIASLIYSDQFLQMTFQMPGGVLYGVGEHRTRLVLSDNWTKYSLWNHDGGPAENTNLYGSHPLILIVNPDGDSTAIYFHNSNAIEIALQPGTRITFRTLGGILEFHMFSGPTPADVISQYTKFVGLPPMPPFWALGFHLCRWGYGSANNTRAVWQRMRDAGIPFDVQWNDIDYMRQNNDFTVDPVNYAELPKLIEEIHAADMHYVAMLDPGISGSETVEYHPFSDGVEMDVFIKDINGSILFGHVWNPNATAYPDFTHPRALEYWSKQLREFRDVVKYDAIWIDMNEPSNFADGSPTGCPDSPLESPPYVPAVAGGKLQAWTICMSNKHAIGSHYNVHNIYAIAEADVTRRALEEIIGKRTFLISRATFAGQGRYSGHWSGDNNSAWSEMVASIVELLTFSLYGIPFMGADICGFGGQADRELCNRWSQLGAFYTFSRNHNTIGARDQDPTSFDSEVTASVKKALQLRYMLLPYLYTLFYHAQISGATVARPLFFEFLNDPEASSVDRAFLWGSGVYIVPVLEEGATTVSAYLPQARWFRLDRFFSNGFEEISEKGWVSLDAPFDTIPVLIRGGSIIPYYFYILQPTATAIRRFPLTYLVFPDEQGNASGSLFWDDGESLGTVENGKYGFVELNLSNQRLEANVRQWNTDELFYNSVQVAGVLSASDVTLNGQPVNASFVANIMTVPLSLVKGGDNFVITWK